MNDQPDLKKDAALTHLDAQGRARMVDVSAKPVTVREAIARGRVCMSPETLERLRSHGVDKGDVLAISRVAAIMASKQTHHLIPLCHGLALDQAVVRFAYLDDPSALLIEAACRTSARTGVEMEALTAVQVGALTVYDMLKGVDRALVIDHVHLARKTGGRSGTFISEHLIPGVDEDALEWL